MKTQNADFRYQVWDKLETSWTCNEIVNGRILEEEKDGILENDLILIPEIQTVSMRIERPGYICTILHIIRNNGMLEWVESTQTESPFWQITLFPSRIFMTGNCITFPFGTTPLHVRIILQMKNSA